MASDESVTYWIHQLKEGERAAVQKLWEGYFLRLVRQTQRWLRGTRTQAVDAEDIALSTFDTFCRRAEQGRFPKLFDRDDLWQLLLVIAFRKSCNQVKHEARRQPATGQVYHASVLAAEDADDAGSIFSHLIGQEPDPAMVVQMAERYRRLLEMLPNSLLRDIAVWKMEGFTNEEIADKIGRSVVTVERKLALIRKAWAKEIDS